MDRQILRASVISITLALAGIGLAAASSVGNVLVFTIFLVLATATVAAITKLLGSVQKADERAIDRSKGAALTAVRTSLVFGALTIPYSKWIGLSECVMVFAAGMMVPAVIWAVLYFIYNWRDTA